MQHPQTKPAFTVEQKQRVHALLGAKVATMMGRKFEEGDWAEIYCRAKNIPATGWSNLRLDIVHQGLGIEHKMLCYRSRADISEACGTRLMHPAATRSIRMPEAVADAHAAMHTILSQYAELINARRQYVQKTIAGEGNVDLRTGWLLWQESLRQFLYFEEEMLAPDPADYTAEWVAHEGRSTRKGSTNLWVYERTTGYKRYSITNQAGAKIQPYFDVPPINDPNLYIFTVIGEYVDIDHVRVWLTSATARDLEAALGSLTTDVVSQAILDATKRIAQSDFVAYETAEAARPLVITARAYAALCSALPGVSDEHSLQQLAAFLRVRGRP